MTPQLPTAVIAFGLAAVLLLPARRAHGASAMNAFENRVAKSAAESREASKVLCVCKEDTSHHNSVGFLRRFHDLSGPGGQIEITVTCELLDFFEETGEFSGQTTCDTWELLPK